MKKSTSYEMMILNLLLQKRGLTSTDFQIANANQYFCNLKNKGIRLKEIKQKHSQQLIRFFIFDDENIKRANEVLERMKKNMKMIHS